MKKEKFINDILNSSNGITKVTPSDELFNKIEQKILLEKEATSKSTWFIAASVLVFLSLNIILLQISTSSSKNTISSFATEINKSNQLYK